MRVYKYPLKLTSGPQWRKLPDGAEVVHVHAQNDEPCLWALVDPNATPVDQRFVVAATGEDVRDDFHHLGTVHIGWTVWHVFAESVIGKGDGPKGDAA